MQLQESDFLPPPERKPRRVDLSDLMAVIVGAIEERMPPETLISDLTITGKKIKMQIMVGGDIAEDVTFAGMVESKRSFLEGGACEIFLLGMIGPDGQLDPHLIDADEPEVRIFSR